MSQNIPLYGQNIAGDKLGAIINCFMPDFITEGKGLVLMKGVKQITGSDTTSDQGQIVDIGVSSSVHGGYVKISGIISGAFDCDLGLVAEATTLGTAYGLKGDGVYGMVLHEFVSVGAEGIFLSVDANTVPNTGVVTVEVGVLMGVAPGTS